MWMICIVQDLKFLVISLQLPNITRVLLLSFEQLVAHEQVQRTHLQSSRCVCVDPLVHVPDTVAALIERVEHGSLIARLEHANIRPGLHSVGDVNEWIHTQN